MVKAALILAKGESGLQSVYGLPVSGRHVLLILRAGGVERPLRARLQESLFSALTDLVPLEAFRVVQDPRYFNDIIGKIAIREGGSHLSAAMMLGARLGGGRSSVRR